MLFKLDLVSHNDPYGIAPYIANVSDDSRVVDVSCYSNSVVLIEIQGVTGKIGALYDTGAVCCAIDLETLKRVYPNYKLEKSNFTFSAANDQSMIPLGTVNLTFSIESHITSATMQVFPRLNQRIILGRDWIKTNKAVINLAKQKLSFECSKPLFTSSTYTMQVGEICVIQTYFGRDNDYHFPNGLHGTATTRHDELHLHLPNVIESVATCNKGMIPVVVKNDTGIPIRIVKDVAIANFTPIALENLNEKDIFEPLESHPFPEHENAIDAIGAVETAESVKAFINRFDFSNTKCSDEELLRLKSVLKRHENAFIGSDGRIGCSKLPPYNITLKPDAKPVCRQPYRLNPALKKQVDEQIQHLLDQNIIEPAENLQFCSPLIAVKKGVKRSQKHMHNPENKSQVRIVLDTRHLNANICYPKHEITSLTSILDVLAEGKGKYFTMIDIKHAYFQVALEPSCRDLTGFLYDNKALRFTRLIQGCSASPMAFTSRMASIFRPYLNKFMVLYLDDCLIFSKTKDEHLKHIDFVLAKLEEYALKLAPNKCHFMTTSATYLGHELNAQGVHPSNEHVKSVKLMPEPENASQLRTQLGLFNFFHSFIPERSKLMKPLLHLTKKGVDFIWTKECAANFQRLKDIVSSKPLLHFPDFDKTFYVMTDSSGSALSGVLLQVCSKTGKFVPIAYASRGLTPNECKRPIFENEALACVFAITSFKHYLSHAKFVLYCDNVAVKYLLKMEKNLSPKMTRWAIYLNEYSFDVHYIKSSENKIADCLSRMPQDFRLTSADMQMEEFPHLPGLDQINIDPTNTPVEMLAFYSIDKQTSDCNMCVHCSLVHEKTEHKVRIEQENQRKMILHRKMKLVNP